MTGRDFRDVMSAGKRHFDLMVLFAVTMKPVVAISGVFGEGVHFHQAYRESIQFCATHFMKVLALLQLHLQILIFI